MGFVYHILCPVKGLPVYVGVTTLPIEIRERTHNGLIKKGLYPLYKYFSTIGFGINCVVIESLPGASKRDILKAEKEWIKKYISIGYELFNKSKNVTNEGIGRNVRVSDIGFSKIKNYVDANGLKLARFIEVAALEKIEAIKKKK